MQITRTKIKNFLLRSKNIFVLSVIVAGIGVGDCSTTPAAETTRDKWLWSFSSASPWNMPIGSDARYTPANLQKAQWIGADVEYIYKTKASVQDKTLQKLTRKGFHGNYHIL